jgi:glucokinase
MHPTQEALPAEHIVGRALSGEVKARATASFFVKVLARFAGDLALMFKATGGVYIGGGVAQRMRSLLDERLFRQAFESHPPYEDLLARIPTVLVTLDEPGLLGCAVIAQRIGREVSAF